MADLSLSEAVSLAGQMTRQYRAFVRIEEVLAAAAQAESRKAELDKLNEKALAEITALEGRIKVLKNQLANEADAAKGEQAKALKEHKAALAVLEATAKAKAAKFEEQAEAAKARLDLCERQHADKLADLAKKEAEAATRLEGLQSNIKQLQARIAGLSA
jgi:chromosome segregation ATPase